MDEDKAVDIVCLDLSKNFDNISHSILLDKLGAHGLGKCTFWVREVIGLGSIRLIVRLDDIKGPFQPK